MCVYYDTLVEVQKTAISVSSLLPGSRLPDLHGIALPTKPPSQTVFPFRSVAPVWGYGLVDRGTI